MKPRSPLDWLAPLGKLERCTLEGHQISSVIAALCDEGHCLGRKQGLLLALAFACVPTVLLPVLAYRPHRPSVDQANSDEMYAVYSAAIKQLFLDKKAGPFGKVSLVVIKDHTTQRYFEGTDEEADPAKRIAHWVNSGITVDRRTIEDFKRKNEQSISLEPRFTLPIKQSLISERELHHYFGEDGGQWMEFDKRHPNSFGYISLSRVGFNPEHDRALLYADLSCGLLCGEGYYLLVAKNGPTWSVVYTDGLWVS
jgi:hypothetical protein